MYKRILCIPIEQSLEDTPVQLIVGARQTGKSTLCKQLIGENIFADQMVTMDDPTTFAAAKADPLGFLLGLGNQFIIDEVQRVPEMLISLKKLVDEDRDARRVILTGSSDVMTLPKVSDSLAGRLEIHKLWPLSQSEITGRNSQFLPTVLSDHTRFSNMSCDWKEIIDLIRIGGYPEAIKRTSENRRLKWFEAYITAILQKDIRELANIDGLAHIPRILQLLSTRVGSTVNMSDIARLARIRNTSFQRYLSLLKQVFLVVEIPAWTPNAEGRYVKSPKVYLNDTGLLCYLKGESQSLRTDRTAAGNLLENYVVMELMKQMASVDTILRPRHFSMHKGAEVDLVLEDHRKNLYGIEIKSTASLKQEDFRGLKKLAEVAGDKFRKGIVLYTGDQFLAGFGGENLYAVPVTAVWAA